MDATIGEYAEPSDAGPRLVLVFYPGAFPVKWDQCSVTAEFFAAYFASVRDCELAGEADRRDFIGSAGYVLNELIENAVKFSAGGTVEVDAGVAAGELVVVVSNEVVAAAVDALRARFVALAGCDPQTELLRRVEENAENPETSASGLGFLTMMSDYQARLGWRFASAPGNPDNALLRTTARLQVRPNA